MQGHAHLSDTSLGLLYHLGDRSAFSTLWTKHHETLDQHAASYAKRSSLFTVEYLSELSWTLLQPKTYTTFDYRRSWVKWTCTILRNIAYRMWDKRARDIARTNHDISNEIQPPSHTNSMLAECSAALVKQGVISIDEVDRLQAYFTEGRTFQEIADKYKQSLHATTNQHYRLIKIYRSYMHKHHYHIYDF